MADVTLKAKQNGPLDVDVDILSGEAPLGNPSIGTAHDGNHLYISVSRKDEAWVGPIEVTVR